MQPNAKMSTLLKNVTLILAVVFSALHCSPCYSQNLVLVNGVTPTCVVNARSAVQHPGTGTLFPSPQYGYCNGSIRQRCATSHNVARPGSPFYEEIQTACVGTFTSRAELQAQQAKNITDPLQQQLNILNGNIKALSDSNDSLTKRLDDMEKELNKRAWQTVPDPVVSDPQPVTTSPQSLEDYMKGSGEPLAVPQLGILVKDNQAKLNNLGTVSGAAVTEVSANGASAGILDDHDTSHMMVSGAPFVAGAAVVIFPPALFRVLMLAIALSFAESHDLIIAVDGNRVRNTLDLIEAVQDTQKGDAVYLTIVRKGERKQIVVHVQ